MKAIPILNATRGLAENQPEYNVLEIRDSQPQPGVNVMTSAWKPTKEELQLLNNDGIIQLSIMGTLHPPVSMVITENITNVH